MVHVDEKGAEAQFPFPDADADLASFLNRELERDPNLNRYDIVVTTNCKGFIIVLGPGDTSKSRFKADLAAIAARFSCVTREQVNEYRATVERLRAEATASQFDGAYYLRGSLRA